MTEIIKICKKHGELTKENCRTRKKDGKIYWLCHFCCLEHYRKYRSENKEKINERRRARDKIKYSSLSYDQKEKMSILKKKYWHSEQGQETYKNYCNKNKLKIDEKRKKHYLKNKERILNRDKNSDLYFKKLLIGSNFNGDDSILDPLIEIKRLQILIKRKAKEIKGGNKQCRGA